MYTASFFMDYRLNNKIGVPETYRAKVESLGTSKGPFHILETLPCGRSRSLACVSSLNGLSTCLQWPSSHHFHHFTYNYLLNRSHSGEVWDRGIKTLGGSRVVENLWHPGLLFFFFFVEVHFLHSFICL